MPVEVVGALMKCARWEGRWSGPMRERCVLGSRYCEMTSTCWFLHIFLVKKKTLKLFHDWQNESQFLIELVDFGLTCCVQ